MDKITIKNKIDFNKIAQNVEIKGFLFDYLQDSEGHNIIELTPLEVKLIEKINDMELRIKELEKGG